VQVEEVLQQLPSGGERRRDQLDQRLGIVGRDVLTGERGAERAWVRRRSEASLRRDAQGLLLQALAATLEDLRLAAVDERGQAPLEGDIEAGAAHGLTALPLASGLGCKLASLPRGWEPVLPMIAV